MFSGFSEEERFIKYFSHKVLYTMLNLSFRVAILDFQSTQQKHLGTGYYKDYSCTAWVQSHFKFLRKKLSIHFPICKIYENCVILIQQGCNGGMWTQGIDKTTTTLCSKQTMKYSMSECHDYRDQSQAKCGGSLTNSVTTKPKHQLQVLP